MAWFFQPLPLAAQPVQAAALGGSALTPQQGAFAGANHTVLLSGSASTCSAGTVQADHDVLLVVPASPLQQIFSAQGQLTGVAEDGPDLTLELLGEAFTASSGTVAPDFTRLLAGEAITSAQQTCATVLTPTTLISQLITGGTGGVTPASEGVTVNLNAGEIEMVAAAGSIPSTGQPLSGQATTSAAGSMALGDREIAISGSSSTFGLGTVSPGQDIEDTFIQNGTGSVAPQLSFALSGIQLDMAQGTVVATADLTIALTGEEDTFAAGTLGLTQEFALTGTEILGEQGGDNFGLPKEAALIGELATVSAGDVFLNSDRSFPLTTQAITAEAGSAVVSNLYFLAGQAIAVEQETIGPKNAALTGESVSVLAGNVTAPRDVGGGRCKPKKHGRRVKLIIDDQEFIVDSLEEAEQLTEQIRALAAFQAEEQARAVVTGRKNVAAANKRPISGDPVKLDLPTIVGENKASKALAAKLKAEVDEIYQRAAIEAEIAIGVAKQRALDEDESLVLLLLN